MRLIWFQLYLISLEKWAFLTRIWKSGLYVSCLIMFPPTPCHVFSVPSMASLFVALQCPSHVVLGQITSIIEILWMRQRVGTAHMGSKQLLLLVFARRSVCQYSMAEENPAAERQTAVTAYLKSKQSLLFVFARRSVCQYSMAEENAVAQRQTAVTAYLKRNQLLLFVFTLHNWPNLLCIPDNSNLSFGK